MKVMDVENQVSHIISNPGGFCRGHIAEPTQDTIKTIMRILKKGECVMYTMEELAEDIDRQCKMIREYGQRLKRRHGVEQNDEKKDGEQ